MKKLLILILLLAGCSSNVVKKPEPKPKPNIEIKKYVDNNPIINGLYNKNNNSRYLVKTINSKFILNKDIAVFSTFFTNENVISNDYIKDVFYNYYNNYNNIENYKLGYTISFNVNEKKYFKQILNIEDSLALYDFIQIYLYDDLVPEKNTFYSHLETISDNTLITTIKLTGSTNTYLITSPITLGVFTYLETDFDENGLYKGKSLYEVNIYNT